MKRLQCVKCEQVFWMGFDPVEEKAFALGDWVQCTCPKCGNEWTSVMSQKGARRGRKALRRAAGRRSMKKTARRGRKPAKRRRKVVKPEIPAIG